MPIITLGGNLFLLPLFFPYFAYHKKLILDFSGLQGPQSQTIDVVAMYYVREIIQNKFLLKYTKFAYITPSFVLLNLNRHYCKVGRYLHLALKSPHVLSVPTATTSWRRWRKPSCTTTGRSSGTRRPSSSPRARSTSSSSPSTSRPASSSSAAGPSTGFR